MSEEQVRPTGRRRAAPAQPGRRRIDPAIVAAVVLPLLVALAVAAVRVGAPQPPATAPTAEARTASTLVCPSAGVLAGTDEPDTVVPTDGVVRVGTGPDADGDVTASPLDTPAAAEDLEDAADVALDAGGAAAVDSGAAVVVRGSGGAAPGLAAARFDASGGIGTTCRTPDVGGWFVGLGAGGERSSVLELTNPDPGSAVARLSLYDESGPVDAPEIRSLVVGTGETRRLDLAELVPTLGDLAVHVDVARGRLGIAALQTMQPLDGSRGGTTWAPLVAEPTTEATILGLPGDGATARTLLVANPGDAPTRIDVDVLGTSGPVRPTSLADGLVVAPGAVATLDLTDVLGEALAEGGGGASGVRVTSGTAVVASLRSGAGAAEVGSVTTAPVPTDVASGALTGVLPDGAGARRLVLDSRAPGEVAVPVVARSASGDVLLEQDVTLGAGAATALDLPEGTARVDVAPTDPRVDVRAALVTGAGSRASVLALVPTITTDLVPTARRAWQ
ncbi:DUF5719 family protein [Nocardioides zeae]|uniref:Secreted protein n=1 Tax=Nocardioides zeae TaxID=1457234 RepID=A0AAJ1WZE5_9ACTN|nr:DUF5719 family protein [Nocardioides zeae]MDQ1103553.1 hypothetical protein [Nocardioides zeae]